MKFKRISIHDDICPSCDLEISIRMDANYIKQCKYPVELAFVDVNNFLYYNNRDIMDKIANNDLIVSSIHAPHFKLEDLRLEVICNKLVDLMRDLLVKSVVIHPSFAKLHTDNTLRRLNLIKSILYDFNICIERFTSKRRWVSTLEEFKYINKKFDFKCCYDYSHVPNGNEETIIPYLPFTPIIHVSNRKEENTQHQRLFDSSCCLDYTKIFRLLKEYNWSGELCLEYMPEYHKYLEQDADKLFYMLEE